MTLEEIILNHYGLDFRPESFLKHEDICFICGQPYSNGTDEHLFPKWLLRDLKLHKKKLILPNESSIDFNKLTITCCSSCNNGSLSLIENKVINIFQKSVREINESEREILFQWLLKTFGGIWLKSTTLKANVKNKSKTPIIPKQYLNNLSLIFSLLKTLKYDIVFSNFKPYSMFLFEYAPNDSSIEFDFLDNFNFPTIAFAYKKVAIIVTIGDYGVIQKQFGSMKKLEYSKINNIDFIKYFCKILTASSLKNNIYNFFSLSNKLTTKLRVSRFINSDTQNTEPLKPWDKKIYQDLLLTYFKKRGFTVNLNKETNILKYNK